MYCSGPPTKIWVWYATVCAPRAFWLVACLQPPPRAQGVTGPPYKGPGSIPPKRCPMITHLFTGLVPRIMRTITPQRGLWWEPRAVRAFGGGSPVREVGTSSCWAPPPSRQPQCGPAAPYHGRLGAITHWGDKVTADAQPLRGGLPERGLVPIIRGCM